MVSSARSYLRTPGLSFRPSWGVSIPERFTIQVHEDDATSAHVVLPLSDRLTEEELAEIAAGVDVNWDTVNIS